MPDSPLSATAPLEAVTLTPLQQDLINILRNIGGPLFAVLDATRDPLRILVMLRSSGEEYQSLYERNAGKNARSLCSLFGPITRGLTLA